MVQGVRSDPCGSPPGSFSMGEVQIQNEIELGHYLRKPECLGLARKLCPQQHTVDFEDILQKTFLRLQNRAFPMQPGIVKRTICNLLIDEYRRKKKLKEIIDQNGVELINSVTLPTTARIDDQGVLREARNHIWTQSCQKTRHGWYALLLRTIPDICGAEYIAIVGNRSPDFHQHLAILNTYSVDWALTFDLYLTCNLDRKHVEEDQSLLFEGVAVATEATAGQSAAILRTTTTTEGKWIARCRKCLEPLALDVERNAHV